MLLHSYRDVTHTRCICSDTLALEENLVFRHASHISSSYQMWFSSALTCESGFAYTLVIVGQLYAIQAVGRVAWVWKALIDISLTAFSSKPWRAVTPVPSDLVHTCTVILALGWTPRPRGGRAVILIYLTENTCYNKNIVMLFLTLMLPIVWKILNFESYPACLEDMSRCSVPPGQCRFLHSDMGETDTRWSLAHSCSLHNQAYTDKAERKALVHLFWIFLWMQVLWCVNSKTTHITGVSSHVASAGGTIEARFILAAIKLRLAVAARVVCGTFAVVRVSSVDTMSTVVAEVICLATWIENMERWQSSQ